jgi:hypothetical protein
MSDPFETTIYEETVELAPEKKQARTSGTGRLLALHVPARTQRRRRSFAGPALAVAALPEPVITNPSEATVSDETLEVTPEAQWILEQESTRGVPSVYRTAKGPFRLREGVRDYYMGDKAQSDDLRDQYRGATKYVMERYGSWERAKRFWEQHGYY